MGAINNLAGAAGVLGLIALEDFVGLEPKTANGSLRLGAVAIGLAGWIGFRSKGHAIPPRAWLFAALTLPGAIAGAVLAEGLPDWTRRVYLLVILSLVLIQQLRNRLPSVDGARRGPPWLACLMFLGVGAHMGFVQIGTGLVTIGALTLVATSELVTVVAMKMAIVLAAASTATIAFWMQDRVVWLPAVLLALGCGVGSFLASRWAVRKGHSAVRAVVLIITTAVLVRIGWQLFA